MDIGKEEEGTMQRLLARERVVGELRVGNAVENWLFNAIETINGLVSAEEWKELNNTFGGKKFKGRFRKQVFEDKLKKKRDELRRLSEDELKKALNKERNRLSRNYRKVVTSRNQGLRLYQRVRIPRFRPKHRRLSLTTQGFSSGPLSSSSRSSILCVVQWPGVAR